MAVTTIDNLRTKLSTHATTAGAANYLWGWFDEVDTFVRKKTTKYPTLVVQPVNWKLNPRTYNEVEIDLKFQVYKDFAQSGSIERSATYDSMITICKAFITAINSDANLQINETNITAQLFDIGNLIDNSLMIAVDTKLVIVC